MSEHTKGPWDADGDYVFCHSDEAMFNMICKAVTIEGAIPIDKAVANAHLIAAAPALYTACQELIAAIAAYELDVEGYAPPAHRAMMARARAAIAKARGQE